MRMYIFLLLSKNTMLRQKLLYYRDVYSKIQTDRQCFVILRSIVRLKPPDWWALIRMVRPYTTMYKYLFTDMVLLLAWIIF